MRFLQRAYRRPRLFRLIKVIGDIHRLFGGPHRAKGLKEGIGARIALVVIEIIAVAALLGVIAAADDMHRQPSAQQMFKGSELTRGEGRRDKTGTMSQQKADLLRRQARQRGHQKSVGLIGPVAHQQAVKPGGLVGLRETHDVIAVKNRTDRGDGFRRQAVADHAEKLNAHAELLVAG